MADKNKAAGRPMFKCNGVVDVGSSPDGSIAFVMLEELGGKQLTLAFPSKNAQDFASRFLTAGDLARAVADKAAGKETGIPAPLVTDHKVEPTGDGQTAVLTLETGGTPLVVRVSKSRSEKIRASLQETEGRIGPVAANSNV